MEVDAECIEGGLVGILQTGVKSLWVSGLVTLFRGNVAVCGVDQWIVAAVG